MKRSIAILSSFVLTLGAVLPQAASAAITNGSLIKGQTSSAVYYVTGGKRYAFPNERVFNSWYPDFSTVQTVADGELAGYLLGGNVTYRPGMQLVKVTTDPKVYAVSRYGVLRWVTNETVAATLFGANWNTKIHDVPDTFFTNYVIGSDLSNATSYSPGDEAQSALTIDEDLRPSGYVPPASSPITPGAPAVTNPAFVVVSVSTPQATQNQTVVVTATVTGSNHPLRSLTLWSSGGLSTIATCLNVSTCSGQYTVTQAPATIRFRAVAVDDAGTTIETPIGLQASVTVPAVTADIAMSAAPMTLSTGSRFTFSSDASRVLSSVSSHKVFIAIAGEPNPTLWKDCGASPVCSGSTPLYRTSQFFSEVVASNQTLRSAAVTVSVLGNGIPHPTLTLISKPSANQAVLQLNAPSGETIGWSTIVEGTTGDDNAIALCELASCEITVQFSKPTMFTGFTNVGGKLEASNTVNLEP